MALSQAYKAWLGNPDNLKVMLAIVKYYFVPDFGSPEVAGERTLYLSSHRYIGNVGGTDVAFLNRILGSPRFKNEISVSSEGNRTTNSLGDLQINNADGVFDSWLGYGFDGRDIELLLGPINGDFATEFSTIFKGKVDRLTVPSNTAMAIVFKDKLADLDKPLNVANYVVGDVISYSLTKNYLGNGNMNTINNPINGTIAIKSDLDGKPKPLVFGEVKNIEPILLDAAQRAYQVSIGPVEAIYAVYDSGVPISYKTGDGAGILILDNNSTGTITCDVKGILVNTGVYSDKLSHIIKYIVCDIAGVPNNDFITSPAVGFLPAGVYVNERLNTLDLLDEVVKSIDGYYGFDLEGKFFYGVLAVPSHDIPQKLTGNSAGRYGDVIYENVTTPYSDPETIKKYIIASDAIAGATTKPSILRTSAYYLVTEVPNNTVYKVTSSEIYNNIDILGLANISKNVGARFSRNYTVQTDLAAAVTGSRKEFASQEWRQKVQDVPGVTTKFLSAPITEPFDTILQDVDTTDVGPEDYVVSLTDSSYNNLNLVHNAAIIAPTPSTTAGMGGAALFTRVAGRVLKLPNASAQIFDYQNARIRTYECRFTTGATLGDAGIFGNYTQNGVASGAKYAFTIIGSSVSFYWATNAGANTGQVLGTVAVNTEYVVAAVYTGVSWRLYFNGTLVATVPFVSTLGPSNGDFYIGDVPNNGVGGLAFTGSIEEVRISNIARYTTSYTPSTVPFSTDNNTLGLYHLDTVPVVVGGREVATGLDSADLLLSRLTAKSSEILYQATFSMFFNRVAETRVGAILQVEDARFGFANRRLLTLTSIEIDYLVGQATISGIFYAKPFAGVSDSYKIGNGYYQISGASTLSYPNGSAFGGNDYIQVTNASASVVSNCLFDMGQYSYVRYFEIEPNLTVDARLIELYLSHANVAPTVPLLSNITTSPYIKITRTNSTTMSLAYGTSGSLTTLTVPVTSWATVRVGIIYDFNSKKLAVVYKNASGISTVSAFRSGFNSDIPKSVNIRIPISTNIKLSTISPQLVSYSSYFIPWTKITEPAAGAELVYPTNLVLLDETGAVLFSESGTNDALFLE